MSFNIKNPISAPTVSQTPQPPMNGTRGLYPSAGGWHDIDPTGKVSDILMDASKDGVLYGRKDGKWESIIPSLTDYATKAYVDTQADAVTPNAFELIASGETTEEVNGIIISKDNDGNPFELCDMINIYIECHKSTNTANVALTVNFNGYIAHQTVTTAVSNTIQKYISFRSIYTGAKWESQSCAAETGSAQIYTMPTYGFKLHNNPTVKSIKIYIYSTAYKLPVGLKYEIYGRRVKDANT